MVRTWHPEGPNVAPAQRGDVLPHHEVLLKLRAVDLERGLCSSPLSLVVLMGGQARRWRGTAGTTS